MTLLKNSIVLTVVAIWATMANHCDLEVLSGLEFLACSSPSQATPHQPIDCGGKDDSCATVESGLYLPENEQVTEVKASMLSAAFALLMLSNLAEPLSSADPIWPEPPPPDLARVWQFSLRAALPARAPTLIF